MARAHAKTNHSHKSSQKTPEAPPPALQPSVSAAPQKQELAPKQEAPKQQVALKQEAPKQEADAVKQAEPTPAPVRAGPSSEQISRRAYEIFLARGSEHGRHEDDWNQAERELQLGR